MHQNMSAMKYPWPSTVNVRNFVTVTPFLGGDERSIIFKIWKTQMLRLLRGQDVVGFVDGEIHPPPEENADEHKLWRRTDELVKGWILGSLGPPALRQVWKERTAREVWEKLEKLVKEEKQEEENNINKYLAVYRAAQRDEWDTALEFFQCDTRKLSTTVISPGSETALHVAVLTGQANGFVKKLVEKMPLDAMELRNSVGQTALHNAAIVGNKEAAVTLVERNRNLLYIEDKKKRLPVQEAAVSCQRETLEYLISQHAEHDTRLFKSELGLRLLIATISSENVDIALDLVGKHPNLALLKYDGDDSALSTIATTDALFPRRENFSWWQKFIYDYGETWMKDTAKACSVAAALIATVMFAAAFTAPKGVESAFHVFVVSDAISLFTSITSLLMFLSIMTARYAERDFLRVLPKRLSAGLVSLFMSITFMMVAFSATLYILLKEDRHMAWFAILIAAFACLPVASFVLLQFPLLVDVLYSTYGYRILIDTKGTRNLLY